MKKNGIYALSIILSILSLIISIMALYKVSKPSSAIGNPATQQESGQVQAVPAKHQFDQSLVGTWTNGYWEMQILSDSTVYISNWNLTETVRERGGASSYFIQRTYIGYIENNKVVIEHKAECSIDEWREGDCAYEEEYLLTDITRETTDSFSVSSRFPDIGKLLFRRQ